jgi:hypothetical protein
MKVIQKDSDQTEKAGKISLNPPRRQDAASPLHAAGTAALLSRHASY